LSYTRNRRRASSNNRPSREDGGVPVPRRAAAQDAAGYQCGLPLAYFFAIRLLLSRLFVQRVPTKLRAILLQLQALGAPGLLGDPVIPQPGLGALQPNVLSRHSLTSSLSGQFPFRPGFPSRP